MKIPLERNLRGLFSAFLLSGALVEPAQALTQDITAVFTPNPGNPFVNQFRNTTPISSICESHIPTQCQALNLFSLRIPGFDALSNTPILANHEDVRKGFMVKVPSQWRDVQVTHTRTGEVETVQMRIAGFGGLWNISRPPGVGAWTLPGSFWSNQWLRAPSPCVSTGHLKAGVQSATYFWIVPEGAGVCSRQPSQDLSYMRIYQMEYAYELRTPNPLGMSSGEYTGSLTYTMGPGADYDFGDVLIPTDNQLTFNFALEVQHELRVEVPPGGTRIELVPQGGWQAWLGQGRKPARLFRDQTFNISASSRFNMQMFCERVIGDTCALRNNTDNHEVPLDISVSLPHGLNRPDGSGVDRQPLLLSGVGTEVFQPGFYVNRRPGTLHFEVKKAYADEMLNRGGSTYSGQVTVVWDSEI